MHDCSYVNTPFLKCIIYEATGEKWNVLPLHNNPSYQTFFFWAKPKSFLLKCCANTVITVIIHLTKILFPPWTSSGFEFVISKYVPKYPTVLGSHLFLVRADPQDGEVDLETEVCFVFEKMVKAITLFHVRTLDGLGLCLMQIVTIISPRHI